MSGALTTIQKQRAVQARVRGRLDWFVMQAFASLHNGQQLEREPFIEPLCFALQGAGQGESARLLITMPPRHLKSFCASVCLPAFLLGLDPSLKIAVATYGQELAAEHDLLFQRLIDLRWFRATFPDFSLERGRGRPENMVTTRGGGRRSVSVGGMFTGVGVDLLIVDDILKAQDASSPVMAERARKFYTSAALTRFNDPRRSRIIAVQQRLGPDDIPTMLLEHGGFVHLNLPSVATRDTVLPMYDGGIWRWRAGDLLSPTRFPQGVLDRFRSEMGEADFSAQFLQDPSSAGSTIVDPARLVFCDAPFGQDRCQYIVQSIDTAVKAGENCDFSVITTWGYDGERWCLLHTIRERLEFPALKTAVLAGAHRWRADLVIIEDGATGQVLWHEIPRAVAKAVTMKPQGNKAERLNAATDKLYSGLVLIPRSEPWTEALVRELRTFPGGRFDDQVDSISQFIAWLRATDTEDIVHRKLFGRPISRPRTSRR
jgi:predicted phage terminase large subunit-like protein